MNITEQISADLVSAMKNKDELGLSTLRLVRSALKNKQIDLGKELTDADAVAVMKTMRKQYQDALGDFQRAGRADLVEKQTNELAVLARYLPVGMNPEELERIVKEALTASGVTDATDIGKAMGIAMKAVEGRAEGNDVRAIVQRLLTP